MRIHLVSVGTRMPQWVQSGFDEFAQRMPPECKLALKEIATPARARTAAVPQRLAAEGERMLAAIPKNARVIALDVAGQSWSSEQVAQQLGRWLEQGRDVALLIGGADGLAPACLERAASRWSLSKLTLPHMLVRVLVAEQLYRASSILRHHPYHRA